MTMESGPERFVCGVMFPLLGVLLACISIPMILQKVPPNRWYGFRTAKTLADANIWYPANRLMGFDLFAVGVAVIVLSLLLFSIARNYPGLPLVFLDLAALLVLLAAAVLHGVLWLSRV